ncbi:MAG TPA: ATP-binding protein [Kofleriaceae bacterium]|jgi:hypothetical protein
MSSFINPFRPGAGHRPPYLAGRTEEKREFERLLDQDVVLSNLVLTGLRGIGKTVLQEELRPIAIDRGWLWAEQDLSESTSVDEATLATRLITDLAVVLSGIQIAHARRPLGFGDRAPAFANLDYNTLVSIYDTTPGLVIDKLRRVLEAAWDTIQSLDPPVRGIVFAYDEAQNLADHAQEKQYPLSLLLDLFQSIQRKGMRFMLALTGLPTLFPKLVDARTFAQRMFHVVFLGRLNRADAREAIERPIEDRRCPIRLDDASIERILEMADGYPYFLQFICREVYDQFLVNFRRTGTYGAVPETEITRKLDTDFFAGRWNRVTDRQRDLLHVIASLPSHEEEFTIQETVEASKQRVKGKPFTASHANQMLSTLASAGLVYKNRHGRYSFAVPRFGRFVLRQFS